MTAEWLAQILTVASGIATILDFSLQTFRGDQKGIAHAGKRMIPGLGRAARSDERNNAAEVATEHKQDGDSTDICEVVPIEQHHTGRGNNIRQIIVHGDAHFGG